MAGPATGNTFRVSYEFMNGSLFTGQAIIAAETLLQAATIADSVGGQALFVPPLPTNYTDFAVTSIARIEPRQDQVVIDDIA